METWEQNPSSWWREETKYFSNWIFSTEDHVSEKKNPNNIYIFFTYSSLSNRFMWWNVGYHCLTILNLLPNCLSQAVCGQEGVLNHTSQITLNGKTSPWTSVCGFSISFHIPQEWTLPYNIIPTVRIHYRIYEFSSDFLILSALRNYHGL